jgi:hypothetical protein
VVAVRADVVSGVQGASGRGALMVPQRRLGLGGFDLVDLFYAPCVAASFEFCR